MHLRMMFWSGLIVIGLFSVILGSSGLAEAPAAPDVSKFAPAADLAAQVAEYIEELEEVVESESEYADSEEKLEKDASVLAVLTLALGLHDQDNEYKAASVELIKAAQKTAEAKDYASAKASVTALKAATTSKSNPKCLKWEKVASLHELMEAVPLVNSRLKRYMRRFDRGQDDIAGYSAVLAVVAQGSIANASETKKPSEVEKWCSLCIQMRDAAGAVNTAAHADDEAAAEAAMNDLEKSCDDCHEVFNPDDDH